MVVVLLLLLLLADQPPAYGSGADADKFFWWVSVQDNMPIRARLQRVQKAQGPLLGRALHRWPTTACDE
jgi:hypothetical protein